jgi:hypothetical protein
MAERPSLDYSHPSAIMSGPFVLLQFGSDPFSTKFEDLEGRAAFTVWVNFSGNIMAGD